MDASYDAAIEASYAAAADPSLWPDALQAIADCFGDVGAILIWRREGGNFGTIVSPALQTAHIEYERDWQQHDIRGIRGFQRSYQFTLDAFTDRDILTPDEIANLPFYSQFLAPRGLRWFASTALAPTPGMMVGLSIQRSNAKPPYSDDELQLLSRLSRHIEQSLRLSLRLFEAESGAAGMRHALDRLGVGLLAIDVQFGIVFSNTVGRQAFYDEFNNVNERLYVRDRKVRAAIERALSPSAATAEITGPAAMRVERTAGAPLTLYALPVVKTAALAQEWLVGARALVLVMNEDADSPPDPAFVRDEFGLTLAEAKLAALVGVGISPKEAAEKLGIAESTARTALKRVFAKVGVSRQAELVALFARRLLR